MKPFIKLTATTVVLPETNIDTDQIIPARFLKVTDKQGLGQKAFHDWRYQNDGSLNPEFPLNQQRYRAAEVLVAGENFGCGSSREHAPWALLDLGIRVVVSTSIADIFRNNSLKNGLLPIVVSPSFHQQLLAEPGAAVAVNLETQTITLQGKAVEEFEIEAFARFCLLSGKEPLDYLLDQDPFISAYELANA